MKIKQALVAALGCLFLAAAAWAEPSYEETAQALDTEWAEIFYQMPPDSQTEPFKALLLRIRQFKAQYPDRAEPLILEAVTLCTLVAADWGLDSLSRVEEAKELFEKSIAIDPRAMGGTAYISLGNLYYRLPGWPISFGDDEQARQYLEAAAKMYPDDLDSNYFLGNFWLEQEDYDKAIYYLEKAEKAGVRAYHQVSDLKVKSETAKALKAARNHDSGSNDFFSQFLPSFAK